MTYPTAVYWVVLMLSVILRILLLQGPIRKLAAKFLSHIKETYSLARRVFGTMKLEGLNILILRELGVMVAPLLVGALFRVILGRPDTSDWTFLHAGTFLFGMGVWLLIDFAMAFRTRLGLKLLLASKVSDPGLINQGLRLLGWVRGKLDQYADEPAEPPSPSGGLLSWLGGWRRVAADAGRKRVDQAVSQGIQRATRTAWCVIGLNIALAIWPAVLIFVLSG